MLFFIISRANLRFAKRKLIQRSYTIAKALFIITQVEIINKKEFALARLNPEDEAFVMYVASIRGLVYFSCEVLITSLEMKEITVPTEYSNFTNIFFSNFAAKLLEYIEINNHSINLKKDKQPLQKLIYSLRSMKLEILKTYIEINLANNFIRLLKLLASIPILFIYKKD